MASNWAHPVFSVEGSTWTWDDVAAFARRHGRWEALARQAGHGLACERAGHVAPTAAVKEAAKAFRYRRRLITAEETEAWLRARRLDVPQWMRWVRHSVLRHEHPDMAPAPADDAEVEELLWVTGRCGGLLDAVASAFAERVAAHVRLDGDLPPSEADVDHAVDRLRAAVVTDDALRDEVARRQLDWLGVELEEARFADEHAAREAVLGVRDDGLALAEVCTLAGVDHVRRHASLDEVDAALRPAVLGAPLGDVVGPVPVPGGFVVARVESKVVPTVDDPDVRRRATEAVVATALRRATEERVQWHDRD